MNDGDLHQQGRQPQPLQPDQQRRAARSWPPAGSPRPRPSVALASMFQAPSSPGRSATGRAPRPARRARRTAAAARTRRTAPPPRIRRSTVRAGTRASAATAGQQQRVRRERPDQSAGVAHHDEHEGDGGEQLALRRQPVHRRVAPDVAGVGVPGAHCRAAGSGLSAAPVPSRRRRLTTVNRTAADRQRGQHADRRRPARRTAGRRRRRAPVVGQRRVGRGRGRVALSTKPLSSATFSSPSGLAAGVVAHHAGEHQRDAAAADEHARRERLTRSSDAATASAPAARATQVARAVHQVGPDREHAARPPAR